MTEEPVMIVTITVTDLASNTMFWTAIFTLIMCFIQHCLRPRDCGKRHQ